MTWKLKRNFIILIIAVATIVLIQSVAAALIYSPNETTRTVQIDNQVKVSQIQANDYPVRLIIPSIKVNSAIEQVGISSRGNMAVPYKYSDTGWYKYGTIPGQKGSAVINGHLDNGFGLKAVFFRLSELKPGDDIFIITKSGKQLNFVVQKSQAYFLNKIPLDIIFNNDDGIYLNLITCSGIWNSNEENYDERLVVFSKFNKII